MYHVMQVKNLNIITGEMDFLKRVKGFKKYESAMKFAFTKNEGFLNQTLGIKHIVFCDVTKTMKLPVEKAA